MPEIREWYQTGPDGAFLFTTTPYEDKPNLCVAVKPPSIPEGKCAVWETEIDPRTDAAFGDKGTGSWSLKVDHRKDDLYTEDGKYEIGTDYEGQTYSGIGAIPAWLSTQAPVAPEPDPYVPDSITMRQCRLMLHSEGLLVGVQAAIDALSEPAKTAAQIEWDYAQTVNRDNPVMQMLASAMELDEGQLDQMFMAASQL